MQSGNLNFLQPSGPLQACNGTALPLPLPVSLYNLVNKANLVHNFFLVRLSISTCFGWLCAIIRRNNCVYVRLGACYSVWMTVWYAGWNSTLHTIDPYRITSRKCRINIIVSADDRHIVARKVQRLIHVLRINCAPNWLYLQDCTFVFL